MKPFEPETDVMTRHEISSRMSQQEAIVTSSQSKAKVDEALEYISFYFDAIDMLHDIENINKCSDTNQ